MSKSLEAYTQWWSLVASLIEANITQLAFMCFLQLKLQGSWGFRNKANFSAMYTVLFVLVAYCVVFYSYVYNLGWRSGSLSKKKKSAASSEAKYSILRKNNFQSILLTRSDPTICSVRPYVYESICIHSRNFLRSLVHALFLANYSVQIGSLFLTDVLSILVAVKFRKCHVHSSVFALILGYYIVFALFDGFFCVREIARTHNFFFLK